MPHNNNINNKLLLKHVLSKSVEVHVQEGAAGLVIVSHVHVNGSAVVPKFASHM